MKYFNQIFTLFLFVFIYSCNPENENHIPIQHDDLSKDMYIKYSDLLKEAYKMNDKIEASIQLANLKFDKEKTFGMLNSGIKENPKGCLRIYDWYWMYDRHNFKVNIVKMDTLLFKASVKLCELKYKESSYQKFALAKDQEMKIARESKETEDSTKFDMALVQELEHIDRDDQNIRDRINKKNISLAMKKQLLKEMRIIDSINLIKIENIFKKYGYPSKEMVGRECNFTPALVIHHSKDLSTRNKHLPLLEDAVNNGILGERTLNMIKKRIKDIEEDN